MSKPNKFIELFSGLRTPDRLQEIYLEIWEHRQKAKESLESLPEFQSYLEADKGLVKLREHLYNLTYKEKNLNQDLSTSEKLVYELSGRKLTFTVTREMTKPRWQRNRINLSSFKLKSQKAS